MNIERRLLRPAYDLNDAARGWHRTLRQVLINLGLTESEFDKALFIHKRNNNVKGVLVAHVDDLLIAGNSVFYETIQKIKGIIKREEKLKKASNSAA